MITNALLSVTIFYNTNVNFVRIDCSNVLSSHVYSIQQNSNLTNTNWCKSWIFEGNISGVNSFYAYADSTNKFYRVQDLGTKF